MRELNDHPARADGHHSFRIQLDCKLYSHKADSMQRVNSGSLSGRCCAARLFIRSHIWVDLRGPDGRACASVHSRVIRDRRQRTNSAGLSAGPGMSSEMWSWLKGTITIQTCAQQFFLFFTCWSGVFWAKMTTNCILTSRSVWESPSAATMPLIRITSNRKFVSFYFYMPGRDWHQYGGSSSSRDWSDVHR